MTIAINDGRKAETPVPANDSAATGTTESVEGIAAEMLEHIGELKLDPSGFSTARAQASDLAKGRNVELFVPHLAGVLDRGNALARTYAARLREAAGIQKPEEAEKAKGVVDIAETGVSGKAPDTKPDTRKAPDAVKSGSETKPRKQECAVDKPADAAAPADPEVAGLVPLAQQVLNSIHNLGLKDPWENGTAETARRILCEREWAKILQLANELAAILKKGNAKAQRLAKEILDVLQLRLPLVTDPGRAEPAALETLAPATVQPNKPYGAVDLVAITELKTTEPFSTLFPIKDKVLSAITADIRKNGYDVSQPVVVWRERDTVVDGHTRLKAASLAGQTHVPVVYREFTNKDQAIAYAIHAQRDRRNLTDADIQRLVDELDKRQQRGGDRRSAEAIKASNEASKKSAAKTAEIIGTSVTKVEKARAISDSKNEVLKAEVASGKKSINRAAAEARAAKKPPEKPDTRTAAYQQAAGHLKKAEQILRPVDPEIADKIKPLLSTIQKKATSNLGTTPGKGAGPIAA